MIVIIDYAAFLKSNLDSSFITSCYRVVHWHISTGSQCLTSLHTVDFLRGNKEFPMQTRRVCLVNSQIAVGFVIQQNLCCGAQNTKL